MKILLVACSVNGYNLMLRLKESLKNEYEDSQISCIVKTNALEDISIKEALSEAIGKFFSQVDYIVFICATGIAVRCIAPYIVSKKADPAVVVMDELGVNVIALLSGHWGNANEFTRTIHKLIGANPIITTATDCNKILAIDEFAKNNYLSINDWDLCKKVSSSALMGEEIGYWVMDLYDYELPYPFVRDNMLAHKINVAITTDIEKKDNVLFLSPLPIYVGVGARCGVSVDLVRNAILECLSNYNIPITRVNAIASIDLKAKEKGIIDFCKENDITFVTFSPKELMDIDGEFSQSEFVKSITGVSNVCERSAIAAGGTSLICKKYIKDKVTVAIAVGVLV